jgi:Fe-S-cluster formation regulator IscX/YfhJ
MLQMCTDRFAISEEYKDALDEMDPKDIVFTLESRDQDDDTASIFYISDIEDLDDLQDDPEDGSELIDAAEKEDALPTTSNLARTQGKVDTARVSRSLRNHDRRPGQYKE